MAQSSPTRRGRMAPRPATDPSRWSRVSGGVPIRRKPPQQSKAQKTLDGLTGLLPGAKAQPSKGGRGGKAGTAAIVTAVAGLAYRNRDKLGALLSRRRQQAPSAQ